MKKSLWAVVLALFVCVTLIVPVQAASSNSEPVPPNIIFQDLVFNYSRIEVSKDVKGLTPDDVLFSFPDGKERTIVYFDVEGPLTTEITQETFLRVAYYPVKGHLFGEEGNLINKEAAYYYGYSLLMSDENHGRVAFMFDAPKGSQIFSIRLSTIADDPDAVKIYMMQWIN